MAERGLFTTEVNSKKLDDYVDILLRYFNSTSNEQFIQMNRGDMSKEEFMGHVEAYLDKIITLKNREQKEQVLAKFKNNLWGFSVLEPLIEDKEISDIKVVTYDNIRVKRNGVRENANVKFESQHEYEQMLNTIAVRNGVNLSMLNAIQTWTDNSSNENWTIRFTAATSFVTSTGQPALHIRKLPKEHRSLLYFEKKGLLVSIEQVEYLKKRITETTGVLIVGKTGAGKTVFYNGLLDFIPRNKSVLVIQENEELNNRCKNGDFASHPEMLFLHTVYASGEGKVEYDLQDLARMGLLFDIDYFAIGEVKGAEAKYLLNCIMTGSIGMCTAHGSSIEDGMDKVADYITYATTYTKNGALEMLQRLNTVIYVEEFEIKDVAEVQGYDRDTKKMIYKHVDFSTAKSMTSHREVS